MKKLLSLALCTVVMYGTFMVGTSHASNDNNVKKVDMDKGLIVVIDGKAVIDNAQYYGGMRK